LASDRQPARVFVAPPEAKTRHHQAFVQFRSGVRLFPDLLR
jgi:hypothetical protein